MAARSGTQNRPAEPSAPSPGSQPERKGDVRRQRLIDATLACFVEEGWARTNMSMIARRAGVTRGMMQYYFPTLQDALEASVGYLNETWRKRYFEAVASRRREQPDGVFAFGIDQLWGRVQEPLHVAKQELEAAARTNADLRAVMQAAACTDEDSQMEAARQVYPDFAAADPDAFRLTRDFTLVFLEGLSLYRFAADAELRRERLLEMLKLLLGGYWRSHGAGDSLFGLRPPPAPARPAPSPAGPDSAALAEAAALITRALALLQEAAEPPRKL